jgi:putative transposase
VEGHSRGSPVPALQEESRALRLDDDAERKLLAVAEQPLKDIIVLMRDTGMRNGHQEYLDFLRQIDNNVPPDLDLHVIVDNYATHKHPRVKRWLGARPRFHVHFTPTYASWLNQVEIWFHRITQRAIRRGTFRSVKELVTKIDQFAEHDNHNARPFVWTATADSIFAKVQRLCERISGTGH